MTRVPFGTEEALPSCIVRPAATEGPYFVEEDLNRFDLRFDPTSGLVKEGLPLHIKFRLSQIADNMCTPLAGAQIDMWHCDALGSYSDVEDRGSTTEGEKWLRGYQVTNEFGLAEFITIYPGWYPGRAVHIHFKIRTDPDSELGYEFTSQLFFPEEITDIMHSQEPYASKGYRNTLNSTDGIYGSEGDQLLLDLKEVTAEEMDATYTALETAAAETTQEAVVRPTMEATAMADEQGGYTATFDIGLDLNAEVTSADPQVGPDGAPPGGPGGPGGPRPTSTPGG